MIYKLSFKFFLGKVLTEKFPNIGPKNYEKKDNKQIWLCTDVNNLMFVSDRVGEYQEEDKGSSKTFGYYDIGSQMHYKRFVS